MNTQNELQRLTVKKGLRPIAEALGIINNSYMNKVNLINAILQKYKDIKRTNIIDEPVPEINVPILKSQPKIYSPKSLSYFAKKSANLTQRSINDFAKWITSYIPKPYKKKINKNLELLKNKIKKFYKKEIKKPTRPPPPIPIPQVEVEEIETHTALRGRAINILFRNNRDIIGIPEFLRYLKTKVIKTISEKEKPLRIQFTLNCSFNKFLEEEIVEVIYTPLTTKNYRVFEDVDIDEFFTNRVNEIVELVEHYSNGPNGGSGLILAGIQSLILRIDFYNPTSGGGWVDLPDFIKNKKAVINPKNQDNECFKWAVTIGNIHTKGEKNKIDNISKKLISESKKLNWDKLTFPVKVKDIKIFEKNNPEIKISVISFDEEIFIPSKPVKNDNQKIIDLLLYKDHYCFITNLSRLLSQDYNKHNGKKFICRNCHCHSTTLPAFEKHQKICFENGGCSVKMPSENETCRFKNFLNKFPSDFVIYADFEAYVSKEDKFEGEDETSFTINTQKHTACSFSYLVKCRDDTIYPPKLFSYTQKYPGENVVKIFNDRMDIERKYIYDNFTSKPKPMIFTKKEQRKYNRTNKCHICEGENIQKYPNPWCLEWVRDHDHLTGKFRGKAHRVCNLICKEQNFVPVMFHNLEGYDSHLFVKSMNDNSDKNVRFSVLAKNEESYISFSKGEKVGEYTKKGVVYETFFTSRYIDSYKFLLSSLDNASKTLEDSDCKLLRSNFDTIDLSLIRKKGIFPYEWFDSFEKLSQTSLPEISEFYSSLNESSVSEENYKHAQTIWEKFNMKTFREYHDLYLKIDVLLLSDVFEKFRDVCYKSYGLDPCHYYTSPGLTWDAFFKISKAKPSLISDYDMYLMIEKGIRGGMSVITKRHSEANNKYMKNFNKEKESKFIKYLDANNLYGTAMCEKMPYSDFKFLSEEELSEIDSSNLIPGFYEVNLEYPQNLHNLYNDYPLAPEKMKINKVEKLIACLSDKKEYVVHHKTLKYYLEMGLILTKIHRVITFSEKDFMKEYIMLNTTLRQESKTDFEKDFYKLMNNSLFGKTMENVRKRSNVKVISTDKEFTKLVRKPNYKSRKIFSENLIAVQMGASQVIYNKPIYLGAAILDVSKIIMYEHHYNFFKKKYGENCKLLFTDTDSLCYEIKTKDFYADIKPYIKERFDTSNIPEEHILQSGINKKVLGMLKDETSGKEIIEFCGLRAKCYSFKTEKNQDVKCKGISKRVIKKSITLEDFKSVLFTGKSQFRDMSTIRSIDHELYTQRMRKVALDKNDDKRYILENGIDTLALGHTSLKIK